MEQTSNIAIQIIELQQKTTFAMWAAGLAFLGTIISAVIAARASHRLKALEARYTKQLAVINRNTVLIDTAIEASARMLFNKLLLAYGVDVQVARQNLFLLYKDLLVIESQFVVYGSSESVDAVYDFRTLVLNTPDDQFLGKWGEIYEKAREGLFVFRRALGEGLTESCEEFEKKLKDLSSFKPPTKEDVATVKANTMGGVSKSP